MNLALEVAVDTADLAPFPPVNAVGVIERRDDSHRRELLASWSPSFTGRSAAATSGCSFLGLRPSPAAEAFPEGAVVVTIKSRAVDLSEAWRTPPPPPLGRDKVEKIALS